MKKNVSSERISGEFVNMTKKVHDSYPSIFTKDDVVLLLIELEQRIVSHETEEKNVSNGVDVKELVKRIHEQVKTAIEDYDFEDNISLDLNYNRQIEISFDTDDLIKECKHSINESVEEYLEEEVED